MATRLPDAVCVRGHVGEMRRYPNGTRECFECRWWARLARWLASIDDTPAPTPAPPHRAPRPPLRRRRRSRPPRRPPLPAPTRGELTYVTTRAGVATPVLDPDTMTLGEFRRWRA
jgi:hypothetical protein